MDELKQRHRAMWASGDFPTLALTVKQLSEQMVEAIGIQPGQRVLDVGAGTGSSAIPAAQAGGDVVASDLTPELFEAGRARAAEAGVELEWVAADAEALPFDDAEFDVTMSAIGAMFAPHHDATARELLRVTKPGGTIAMANWTPEGPVGQMFRLNAQYAPPPPPGAQPPILWGSEDHVRELLGPGCSELQLERRRFDITFYDSPDQAAEMFKAKFGPVITLLNHIGDDAERRAEWEAKFLDYWQRSNLAEGDGTRYDNEFLLVLGTRA